MAEIPQFDDDQIMSLQASGKISPVTADIIRQKQAQTPAPDVIPEASDAPAGQDSSAGFPVSQANPMDSYKPTLPMDQVKNLDAAHMYDPTLAKDREYYQSTGQLERDPASAPALSPNPSAPALDKVDTSLLATKQPSAPLPQMGLMGQGYKDIMGGLGMEAQGAKDNAAALSKGFGQRASLIDDARKKLEDFDKQYQQTEAERKAFVQGKGKEMEQIMNAPIDANRFWNSQSTGQKIGASIGIALGAIGAAMTGSGKNEALGIIDRAIDRDIDAQKNNKSNTMNAYKMLYDKFGDDKAAILGAKTMALNTAELQIKSVMANTQSEQVKAQAKQMLGEIQMKKGELGQQFEMQMYRMGALQQATTGKGVENPMFLPEDMQKKAVKMPDGFFRVAASEDGAKEIAKTAPAVNDMKATIAEMKQLQNEAGVSLPYSEASAKAKSLMSRLMFQNQKVEEVNRLSEPDIHLLEYQIADPTSFRQAKSTALMDQMSDHLNTKMNNLYSQHIPGFRPIKTTGAPDMRK